MRRLLAGVNIGDERFDEMPLPAVRNGCRDASLVVQNDEPDWVDWQQVQIGQEIWKSRLGQAVVALNAALMQGLTIARFAEVLYDSGYSRSAKSSWDRYRDTAFVISDWFRFSLRDPQSAARQSIYRVRCMHTCARHRSAKLFDQDAGEGVALSQYDIAEVQMGFSSICISLMLVELQGEPLAEQEREAMIHCWRLIGWHLGLQDRFNSCTSLQDSEALMEDYMQWTPARFQTCRATTHDLQKKLCEGLGQYTGLGVRYYEGFISSLQNSPARNMRQVQYLLLRPLQGMTELLRWWIACHGKPWLNKLIGDGLIFARTLKLEDPARFDAISERQVWKGKYVMDGFAWPCYSAFYQAFFGRLRPVVLLLLLLLFRRRLMRLVK